MTVLPIVDRELQAASRRKSTYNLRMIAAILALGVSFWILVRFAAFPLAPSTQGRMLFEVISWGALCYCLLLGVPIASDCVSREKREGTLGFLFLTSLRAHDIILGKLAGTSINAIYCLVAIIPVLALPLQLGGISGHDVILVVAMLSNALFFSVSAALFVSVVSRDERRAMFAAFLLIASMAVGPFCLAAAFDDQDLQHNLMTLSPAFSLDHGLIGARLDFQLLFSFVFVHLLSWFLLSRAARILARVWHEQSRKTWLHRNLEKLDRIGYGNSAQRKTHRRRLLSGNPYVWLASRDRWKARYVWILMGFCLAVWIWTYSWYGFMAFDESIAFILIFLLNSFLKVWVASEVCHRMIDDRRTGALELLLTTPMTGRDYLSGIGQALVRQFGLPVVILLIGQYLLISKAYEPQVACLYLLMLPLDLATMAVAGMLLGLTSKNVIRSLLGTVALVCGTPYFLYFLLSPLFVLARGGGVAVTGDKAFVAFLWLWFFLGLGTNLCAGVLWGWRRLMHYSQSAAAFHAASSMERSH